MKPTHEETRAELAAVRETIKNVLESSALPKTDPLSASMLAAKAEDIKNHLNRFNENR